jgi:hypothetical protein
MTSGVQKTLLLHVHQAVYEVNSCPELAKDHEGSAKRTETDALQNKEPKMLNVSAYQR